MTDTTAPTPAPWYALLQALTPSLNTSVTAIAGAVVGIITTLGTQWVSASPPAPPSAPPAPRIEVQKVETTKVIVDPVLLEIVRGLSAEVTAIRKSFEEAALDIKGNTKAIRDELAAQDAARKAKAAKRAAKAGS